MWEYILIFFACIRSKAFESKNLKTCKWRIDDEDPSLGCSKASIQAHAELSQIREGYSGKVQVMKTRNTRK